MTADDREAMIRDVLAQRCANLEPEATRALETRVVGIMPGYIGGASTQCRETYVSGHYYACITLTISVAEGLSKYAARRNNIRVRKDFGDRVTRLRAEGCIPDEVVAALHDVWGSDGERNAHIHMNEDIETAHATLKARALSCVRSLYVIESFLFAHSIVNAAIRPHRPQYWDLDEDGNISGVWLRLDLP